MWIFKVYIALFNFQSAHSHRANDRDLIYHRFFILQIVFGKIFDFFSNRRFFQTCDPQNFLPWFISLAASSHSTRNRNIIYHRFETLQIIFLNFFQIFFQNRKFSKTQSAFFSDLSAPLHCRSRRATGNIIYHHFKISQALTPKFFAFFLKKQHFFTDIR